MKCVFYFGIFLIGLSALSCVKTYKTEPSLYKIKYKVVTDIPGGPIYHLSFKDFNIDDTILSLTDSIIMRIKFANPPQNDLMGVVYSSPRIESGITTFSFSDTDSVGLDSIEIRERFMQDIVKNRIDIYANDSILQSISIKNEPIFEYMVGTEEELSKRE